MGSRAAHGAFILNNYGSIISDEDCKKIVEKAEDPQELVKGLRGPFNKGHANALSMLLGDMDDDHNFEEDGDLWADDVLDKYADYVHNYLYTYNDEALKVDPGIDTQQEHIGPMAQDLEKVNPAVVVEDPETGYKTVDTGRLALMNAGAIAELARQLSGR